MRREVEALHHSLERPEAPRASSGVRLSAPLLLALYFAECCLLVALLGLHKRGETSEVDYLASTPGLLSIAASLMFVLATWHVAWRIRRLWKTGPRSLRMTLALHVATIVVCLLLVEIALRLVGAESPRGVSVLGSELLPYSWERVVERNRAFIARASPDGQWSRSYLVPDPVLGWTVGPSRRSADGMHFSSSEGIRSGSVGQSFADRKAGRRIVALVGDSHTFGLDVSYEDSWGHQLQEALGADYLVLNFGVNGYGVDQAFLRYRHQVKAWNPEWVLFGVAQHDLERTMSVYTFLTFPTWEFPFSKPRFDVCSRRLELVHAPSRPPAAAFNHGQIEDLPMLRYEVGYHRSEWEQSPLDSLYLARLLMTRFRPWPAKRAEVSAPAERSLNTAILEAFLSECESEGSTARIVYMPTLGAGDFGPADSDPEAHHGLAKRVLRQERIAFEDLTEAVRAVAPSRRFPAGKIHYSADGCRAVAEKIARFVRGRSR